MPLSNSDETSYVLHNGVFVRSDGVNHREDEYASETFSMLLKMQQRHFWYRGRHRFLWHAVRCQVLRLSGGCGLRRAVDLGGGCGGWLQYLLSQSDLTASELALADSSLDALGFAGQLLPPAVARYQVDLLNLGWRERWDTAFLLDVLEHIPDDRRALSQVYDALAPGGLLFITTPALRVFWTWNDDLVHHQRRYSKHDFRRLAANCGFQLLTARYFMFFLSPLLLASRWISTRRAREAEATMQLEMVRAMHRVPSGIVNRTLTGLFALETPLGHYLPFPWGTSILTVLRKPEVGA